MGKTGCRRSIGAVHEQVKGYGSDGLIGEAQLLHFRDELDPGIGHADLHLRILFTKIIGEGPDGCGNETRAQVAVGKNDI